jgi:HK97 family phage major capsid protein
VVNYTLPQLMQRIQKYQESLWTTAITGSATVGKTLESATAITYADLLDWEHSLYPSYRNDAAFVISDSLYRAMRGIVDSQSRPILDEQPNQKFQATFHGLPVLINENLGTLAANNICGAFVSSAAIKIVDVMNARLARYSNLPSNPDQIGLQMFQNGGMGYVSKGISLLKAGLS